MKYFFTDDPFTFKDEWISILVILIILIISYLIGFRQGRKFFSKKTTNSNDFFIISSIQSGSLSLLGILLAFSFSVAATRYEERRTLIDREGTSIGTAYFRVGLLKDSTAKKNLRKLLKKYLATRIQYYNQYKIRTTTERQDEIQTQLINLQVTIWAKSAKIGKFEPNVNTSLIIQSLNSIVDTSESISSALENRAPITIVFILILISIFSFFSTGYYHGYSDSGKLKFAISLAIIISSIMLLIIDLDRPLTGIVNLDVSSLENLQKTLEKYGEMNPTENY
ncbi:MAG: hypothetical protein J7604_20545 [Sporocytophaga sp.]|uniref:bestrophin-like domain n=1 Tax=Sporocytophaga sp. TaxID=2231183 RepID=UPI001B2D42BE|nr:hypothetical protein [Sporocytophaga sp.]MBO9702613.1 hypothetical protein [Sporocytophaga sp.]